MIRIVHADLDHPLLPSPCCRGSWAQLPHRSWRGTLFLRHNYAGQPLSLKPPAHDARSHLLVQAQQRREPLLVEADDGLTINYRDRRRCETQPHQVIQGGRILPHISGLKRDAVSGEELLHPLAENSAGLAKDDHGLCHGRFLPEPQGRQDLRPSTGEDALGVTLHHRLSQGQNPRDSPVGDAINAFRPSLRTVANPHYRKAGQMATDPPLRGADQIRELSHALLCVKEVLENPEPRQIA